MFSWTPSPRRRPGDEFNGGPASTNGPIDFMRQEINRFGRAQSELNIIFVQSFFNVFKIITFFKQLKFKMMKFWTKKVS